MTQQIDPKILQDPLLQDDLLTPNEMAMLADVLNPGLGRWAYDLTATGIPGHIASSIRLSVADSFELYPGLYEEKWHVDRTMLNRKLRTMSDGKLTAVSEKIDQFWEAA